MKMGASKGDGYDTSYRVHNLSKLPHIAIAMKYFVEVSGPQQDHNVSLS